MNQSIPKLKVEFVLNDKGEPTFIDQGGVKHFRIKVSAENTPEDVYSVQYQLHPSYVNSFRIEDDRTKSFMFNTTTYGDYSLAATVLGKITNYQTSCIVSKALQESSEPLSNPAIKEAINMIRGK